MPQESYVLVCAAPGTKLGETLDRAQARLADLGMTFARQDVEDKTGLPARALVRKARSEAVKRWNEGLRSALRELDPEAKVRMISCHLTLYDKETNSFFAPAIAENFMAEGQVPRRIVLLIDDIFDMAARLNRNTQEDVFNEVSEHDKIAQRLREKLPENESGGQRELTDTEDKLALLEARTSTLLRLLAWRRSEMIAAENLSFQLGQEGPDGLPEGIPLVVLGVKHPASLARLLLNPNRHVPIAYISHPITRLRNAHAQPSQGRWDVYTDAINVLPVRLAELGVAAIMPTAIDELRFSRSSPDFVYTVTGGMSDRWPLIHADAGLLTGDFTPRSLELPDGILVDAPVATSVLLRSLETAISDEVPFRDHFLVANCPGFFAFRPRENGERFSGGVLAEIRHFARLADVDLARRMVVVHDPVDVRNVVGRMAARAASSGHVRDQLLRLPTEKGIERLRVELDKLNITASEGSLATLWYEGKFPSSLLHEMATSQQHILAARETAISHAAMTLIYFQLTDLEDFKTWCRLIIADASGDPSSWDFLEKVASFLKGDNEVSSMPEFEEQISAALGETPQEWFRRISRLPSP